MASVIGTLRRDERGMSLVFVGLGFMGLLAATTLAIDVGMLMTARSQAQNAADAAAHAGAVALAYDDYVDRSATSPAVQSAINAGKAAGNRVMNASVSITAADVTFPNDPNGIPSWVRVNVFRSGGRANPVSTLMASIFGVTTADITATATGEASLSNAETCVKPFTIPDRWIEIQTPAWDPNDTFDLYKNKGALLPNPDVYHDVHSSLYTGYNMVRDRGLQVTLKAGTNNNITPSFYYPLALPGSGGGSDYRWNIENCNTSIMQFDDLMIQEPGNMIGPTAQGIQTLIDKDPSAYWDTMCNCVHTSMRPSPRVAIIPIFDPVYYETGKQNGRIADLKAANFIGFFIEGLNGNDVLGRVTPVGGLILGGVPVPIGAYPRTIRIAQ